MDLDARIHFSECQDKYRLKRICSMDDLIVPQGLLSSKRREVNGA